MGMGFYNPFYPMNQNMMNPSTMSSQSNDSNIIWVQGEAGAKAYFVARGCTVALWDSENQLIYIKRVDEAGIPSMRVMQWNEITNAPRNILSQTPAPEIPQQPQPQPQPQQPTVDYVTREEFDSLTSQFKDLSAQLNTLSSKTVNNKPYNQPKKEEKSNGQPSVQ